MMHARASCPRPGLSAHRALNPSSTEHPLGCHRPHTLTGCDDLQARDQLRLVGKIDADRGFNYSETEPPTWWGCQGADRNVADLSSYVRRNRSNIGSIRTLSYRLHNFSNCFRIKPLISAIADVNPFSLPNVDVVLADLEILDTTTIQPLTQIFDICISLSAVENTLQNVVEITEVRHFAGNLSEICNRTVLDRRAAASSFMGCTLILVCWERDGIRDNCEDACTLPSIEQLLNF